jgi:hypothetical protein
MGVGTWGYVGMDEKQRDRQRATRTPWWAAPSANTLDVATATFPALLAERLDEIGIDFAVMYGSSALVYPLISDDQTRQKACRAMNRYAAEAFAKSLFFGGVTDRFPGLRIGLLEGGVHWGVGLYGDLWSRWEKRNAKAVNTYDPKRLDAQLFQELEAKYGGVLTKRAGGTGSGPIVSPTDNRANRWAADGPHDDFAALTINGPEDVRDRFVPNFFFGCEADDPMTASAFDQDRIPLGAQLSAMFSSDIGHWDVPDMTDVLEEAYGNVEKGWLDTSQFRDFVFGNVLRFYTDTNPEFFRGTAVEAAVESAIEANRADSETMGSRA